MKSLIPTAAAVFFAAGAVPAMAQPPSQPAPSQACLQQNMVYGWKVVNDQTLIVTDKARRRYKISLARGCHDLNWPLRLAFDAGTGFGISCLKRSDFVVVPPSTAQIAQRCIIESVVPYTPAMEHADAAAKAMGKPD